MVKPNRGEIPVRKSGKPERVSASEWYRRMTMAVNLRLTHAVKDRAVQHFQVNGSELLISFVDGSTNDRDDRGMQ